ELGTNLVDGLRREVEIGVVGDRDVDVDAGPHPCLVARYGDLPIRNGVHRPVEVAQHRPTQAEVLYHPGDPGDAHHVPLVVLVLEHHEDPRQPVADQRLGPESNGDAHDSQACDGRTDVDLEAG